MSFTTIAQCANDIPFQARLTACYAAEGVVNPEAAMWAFRWTISADPSVAGPFESAVLNGNPNPGGDPAVITDGMLTAAVQAHPFEPTT